jgi:hypothetical protein
MPAVERPPQLARFVLTLLCLLTCVALAVLATSATDYQWGVHTTQTFPNGARVEHRRGLFSGGGRLTWGSGTFFPSGPAAPAPLDPAAGWDRAAPATRPSDVVTAQGVFTGDFSAWYGERDENFVLGFGHNHTGLISPNPQWNDHHWWIVAVPHWYIAALLLVIPACHAAARAFRWRTQKLAGVVVLGFAALALYGTISVAAMPCGAPLLLVVGLMLGGVGGAFAHFRKRRSQSPKRPRGFEVIVTRGQPPSEDAQRTDRPT